MKQIKKWMSIGITILLVMGVSACGGKGGEASKAGKDAEITEELVPDYTYQAEYIGVPEEMNLYNAQLSGNQLYGISGKYDEESGSYVSKLVKSVITDSALEQGTDVCSFEEGEECNSFCLDGEGNLYLLVAKRPELAEGEEPGEDYSENYYRNVTYHLKKFDGNGTVIYDEDVSEILKQNENFYVSVMTADGEGNVYLLDNSNGIFLFDRDGKAAGIIPMNESWFHSMGMAKDGSVYVGAMSYTGEGGKSSLIKLDFANKKLGESYPGFLSGNSNGSLMIPGAEGGLLGFDESGVYEYSPEKQEPTKLLTWLDCDIDGSSVSAVSYGKEGVLYVVLRNWESGQTEIAKMNKVRTEDVAKREIISIGVLYGDGSLSRKIVEFNKNNSQYRVKIKTYMDLNNLTEESYREAITNFTNDLTGGNSPDIIDLSGLDIENLVEKGVLEDLMPYVEKSAVISKEDIFPAILKGATYDNVLAYVPSTFVIRTLAAKESIVGSRSGWTCSDMIALAKQYPNADILEYNSKETILSMMLMLGKDHFIDEKKQECHFDTDDFKEVLQFANTFPDEITYSERLTPYRLKDDSLLVTYADIYDFSDVQSILAYFGEEKVNFIGYPTYGEGNGCIIVPGDSYGLFTGSSCKDGAFSVLEFLLNSDSEDEWRSWGFSSFISRYEKQKEEALQVEYVYDENGEIMLDDEGNPIYEGGSGYSMMGDNGEEWSYEYRPIKAEEVELVERMMNDAIMRDSNAAYGSGSENALSQIINEEAGAYFKGSKSLEEVASIIQNRVNLYLKENE